MKDQSLQTKMQFEWKRSQCIGLLGIDGKTVRNNANYLLGIRNRRLIADRREDFRAKLGEAEIDLGHSAIFINNIIQLSGIIQYIVQMGFIENISFLFIFEIL